MYLLYLFNFVLWLWAGILLSSPEPILPTPLSQLWLQDYPLIFAGVLMVAAALGQLGLRGGWHYMLLPQQLIAMIVSLGAIIPVWNEVYPDGVARGWRFILADQALAVLLGTFHTLAIIDVASWRKRRTWWI